MAEAWVTWLDEVLGRHRVVGRLPGNDRKADKGQHLSRVADHRGRSWILKRVAVAQEWRAETHAYDHWVGAIQGYAPTLLAADEELRVLLLSEVPGRHPRPANRQACRQAGALLHRLHHACPHRPERTADRDHAAERVDRLLAESGDALGPQEQEFVRGWSARLADLPLGQQVPCHGDYRQHNWLVDDAGTLRLIDLGKSRWDVAARDLGRLFFRPWWRRPRLAAAFLEGYGRGLSPEEAELIRGRTAVDAVSHVAFGVKRGSERHVRLGQSRLADLMAGHRVVAASLLQQ